MRRDLAKLADEEFDLLVAGGGITGAAIARDAALRGLRVALVEKEDFGAATSSASSKLIHGGIRLLQQGRIPKVVESLRERTAFLRIAPHLVHPLPFLVPTYGHGARGPELLGAGMAVYELLSLARGQTGAPATTIPRARYLPRRRVEDLAPEVPRDGLTGAFVYHDAQMTSSERTTLAFLESAAREGAELANYVEVTDFPAGGGRVEGAEVVDRETSERFRIRARLTCNATGPWAFHTASGFFGAEVSSRIAYSKGVHLVVKRPHPRLALALATRMPNEALLNRGGRHVFLIPWRGRTLIGTTNVPFEGNPDDVGVGSDDVSAFLDEIRTACPDAAPDASDVVFTYGGLYPLIDVNVKRGVYQGSAEYRIYDHAAIHGVDGLLTVIGAKFTTARSLAERVVDRLENRLGHAVRPCVTATRPVPGSEYEDSARWAAEIHGRYDETFGVEPVDEVLAHFGSEAKRVFGRAHDDPKLAQPLSDRCPVPGAWILHSIEEEQARTLPDLVFRRTGMGTIGHPGMEALRTASNLAARALGWTGERAEAEIRIVDARFPARP